MIDYTEGAAAYAKEAETKEQRKQRLATARREYYEKIDQWAKIVRATAPVQTPNIPLDEQWYACKVAAYVLEHSSIAEVKRAVAYVNKQSRGNRETSREWARKRHEQAHSEETK